MIYAIIFVTFPGPKSSKITELSKFMFYQIYIRLTYDKI